jgi:hypothetical protein
MISLTAWSWICVIWIRKNESIAAEDKEKKALQSFLRMRQGDNAALKATYVKNRLSILKVSAIGVISEDLATGYEFDPQLCLVPLAHIGAQNRPFPRSLPSSLSWGVMSEPQVRSKAEVHL